MIYTRPSCAFRKSLFTRPSCKQTTHEDGIYRYTRRLCELHKGILFTRPSCKQTMHKDGIYTRRSCELYKGIILHDRDVWNRQYTRVGATLQIDIGSYSSRSFGDLRTIIHGIQSLYLPLFSYKVSNLTVFFLAGWLSTPQFFVKKEKKSFAC